MYSHMRTVHQKVWGGVEADFRNTERSDALQVSKWMFIVGHQRRLHITSIFGQIANALETNGRPDFIKLAPSLANYNHKRDLLPNLSSASYSPMPTHQRQLRHPKINVTISLPKFRTPLTDF